MNTINENIKKLRNEKGLTQQQIADKLYVTRQCVSRWEHGKTIPDIKSLEKLAILLDCSVNDIIDNESVKSIAIEGAIATKKKTKFLWTSIVISVLALCSTIVTYISFGNDNDEYYPRIQEEFAYVTKVDVENSKIYFSKTLTDLELPVFNLKTSNYKVLDNRNNIISFEYLKVDDRVRILYDTNINELREIKVIDSKVITELYGVFLSTTGKKLNSYNEIRMQSEYGGVEYVYIVQGNQLTPSDTKVEFILEDTYRAAIYDVYVDVDPLKIEHFLEIGLITSDGIKIVDVANLKDPSSYTYTGEYKINSTSTTDVNSIYVTYRVHINFKFSYSSIEVYEYDKNNQLIKESILDSYDDVLFFKAHDEGLYSKVKINSTYTNGYQVWNQDVVQELLLGEKVSVKNADNHGFIIEQWFRYE